MAEQILRLGIDPRKAVQGERQFTRTTQNVTKSSTRAAKSVDKMGASFDRSGDLARKAQRAFAAVGVTIGAGALIRGIVNTNREFQRLQAQLQTTEGSAAGARKAFKRIEEFAIRTPFEIENLTSALVQLRVRGANPTNAELTALGNLSSSFTRDITEVADAVSSAVAGMTRPLRNLGFEATTTGDQITLAFGGSEVTVERSASAIISAMAELTGGKLAGAMEREMNTINGALSNLEDSAGKLARAIGQAGLNDAILNTVQSLDRMTNAISENERTIKLWTGVVLDASAAVGAAGLLGTVLLLGNAMRKLAIAQGAVAFASLALSVRNTAAAVALLQAAMGPAGWMKLGVAALATGFFLLRRQIRGAREELKELNSEAEFWRDQNEALLMIFRNPPAGGVTGLGTRRASDEAFARDLETRNRLVTVTQALADEEVRLRLVRRESIEEAEVIMEASRRELEVAQRMVEARQQGQFAVDELTIALAGEEAALENVSKVEARDLDLLEKRAQQMAALEILLRKMTDAERAREKALRDSAQAAKDAARSDEQRKQFYLQTGLGLAGEAFGDSDAGGLLTGVAGGALAGSAFGPWGAVAGGAAALVGGLLGLGKKAREEARRLREELERQEDQRRLTRFGMRREFALRRMEVEGRKESADAYREVIAQTGEYNAAVRAGFGSLELGLLESLQAAEKLARAEEELAEARRRAAEFANDVRVRAFAAAGDDAAASRARLRFSQSGALAGALPEQRATLTLLHSMESAQLEFNIAVRAIEDAANRQIELLERQTTNQEEALRVAENQMRTAEQALEAARRVVETLREFRDSLALGSLSTLSPTKQLEEARRQFNTMRALALAGDQSAAESLPETARAFLEISREVNASTTRYANDFEHVRSTLDMVEADFADQAEIQEAMLAELRAHTAKLERQIAEMRAQQVAIRENANDQIAALQKQFKDRQNNTLGRILQELIYQRVNWDSFYKDAVISDPGNPPASGGGTIFENPPASGGGTIFENPPASGGGTIYENPPASGGGTIFENPPASGGGTTSIFPGDPGWDELMNELGFQTEVAQVAAKDNKKGLEAVTQKVEDLARQQAFMVEQMAALNG